jgi:hypothetical protein
MIVATKEIGWVVLSSDGLFVNAGLFCRQRSCFVNVV